MNKGIWAVVITIAFVIGTMTTGTVAYAAAGGQGNDAIVQALNNIASAISGINPTVEVDPTPVEVNIEPEVGSLELEMFATALPTVTGSVVLVQPEFNVAGFNQVIATENLGGVSGPAAETFEPFVFVSVRTSSPSLPDVAYNGDVSHEVVVTHTDPGPGGEPAINYNLHFRLPTQPLPPFPDGSPAPGDPAPAGSKVIVDYRVVFAKFAEP